jgi:uncharacterized protein
MKRYFVEYLSQRLLNPQPFIQVVVGPRQVGKTTGVLSLKEWFGDRLLYFSADDLIDRGDGWLPLIWQEARTKSDCILVVDEIQKVPRWSEQVKALFDQDRERVSLQVVLLGSSNLLMQQGLSESLLGRFEILRVPHWNFAEHKEVFGWELDTFLQFGGYPAPALVADDPKRWRALMLDSVIEPLIVKDLLLLKQVNKLSLLRQTLALAMSHPAQELSLSKMLGQLQDGGNITTIKSYLELLDASYLLKLIYKYSPRPISTRSSTPKLLPLAPALISAYQSPQRVVSDPSWYGRVFEAAVGAHLLRASGELHYWRQGNDEVDFVLSKDNELFAIEVKSGLKVGSPTATRGMERFSLLFPKARKIYFNKNTACELLTLQTEDAIWALIERMVGK